MKKYINFLLNIFYLIAVNQSSLLFTSSCNQCTSSDCQTDSKTFFRTRSIIEDVSFFLGLNQYNYYRRYFEPDACDINDERIHFAMGGFFEKSRPGNNMGRFFFSGGTTTSDETPDPGTVESIITVSPERSVAGAYFDYHQDFSCPNGLWLDVKFAIYQATHTLNAQECDLATTNTSACTPLCFLGSNALTFGKISTGKLKNSNFDDIEAKLGYYFYNCIEKGYLGLYASALFPIAPEPTAKFLFEPLVGRGHWGLGAGLNAAHIIYRSENTSLTLLTDVSYQYLFKRNELRSLDLKIGQLTRFMGTSTEGGTTGAPAINFTTLNLGVTPRGVINFWLASHLQHCKWHVELGYNLWWRESEKICFPECEPTNFDSLGVSDSGTFIPLTLENLDLASTSHPRTLTNKIYLAISCDVETCGRPTNIGLAGSYEFSRNINSLEQWGIWGNIETSF